MCIYSNRSVLTYTQVKKSRDHNKTPSCCIDFGGIQYEKRPFSQTYKKILLFGLFPTFLFTNDLTYCSHNEVLATLITEKTNKNSVLNHLV